MCGSQNNGPSLYLFFDKNPNEKNVSSVDGGWALFLLNSFQQFAHLYKKSIVCKVKVTLSQICLVPELERVWV